jgi:hypothetical protein
MFHSRSLLVPFSFPSILALRSTDCHPRFRDIMPCSHFVPFSFPFCSLFVPFLFPHFFCSEEYCTPPKLDVFPFHSLLVRSFFTSDEYCTTPKLPCCVLAFPSRSPLPPSFFQLWGVCICTPPCCVSMFQSPVPFPFPRYSTLSLRSLARHPSFRVVVSCSPPVPLPFPHFSPLSITFLLLFLTFLNALLSVNFIYYKFNCGYIKIHFIIFKIYFFMKYLGPKNKETCSSNVKCLFLFSFLF